MKDRAKTVEIILSYEFKINDEFVSSMYVLQF